MTLATPIAITEPVRLEGELRRFWPRWVERKFTPSMGEAICHRLRRYGTDDVLDSIAAYYESVPDSDRPNWNVIEGLIGKRARSRMSKGELVTDIALRDALPLIRHWAQLDVPFPPAVELVSAACERPDLITAADVKNWELAITTIGQYRGRWLARRFRGDTRPGSPWPGSDGQPTTRYLGLVEPADAIRAGRAKWLERCHLYVRNLRTFGQHTTEWRARALEDLEADAVAGGVSVDEPESGYANVPF